MYVTENGAVFLGTAHLHLMGGPCVFAARGLMTVPPLPVGVWRLLRCLRVTLCLLTWQYAGGGVHRASFGASMTIHRLLSLRAEGGLVATAG